MVAMQQPLRKRHVVGVMLTLLGVFMLLGAAGAFIGGNFSHNYVASELKQQRITFPTDMSREPEALRKYAGQVVDTGPEAKAYATMIKGHVAKATGGKTFSEVSNAARQDPNNQELQQARRTALEGNTVYGSLQNAYGWWLLGSIGKYSAAGLVVGGVLFLLIGWGLGRNRV